MLSDRFQSRVESWQQHLALTKMRKQKKRQQKAKMIEVSIKGNYVITNQLVSYFFSHSLKLITAVMHFYKVKALFKQL